MATPRIDAMQSVMPARVTEPGRARRIAFAGASPEALQSRLRAVVYYRRAAGELSSRAVVSWVKETLSAALAEEPVLAGRLRKGEPGWWEVRFNDAGVRLVQATVEEETVEEWLEAEAEAEADDREAQLAYWAGVDAPNPDFSPLFCIQITEFKGEGYSLGISCSLLLADPLFLISFLKKWALAHSLMLAQGPIQRGPLFDLGYFQRPGRQPATTNSVNMDCITVTAKTSTLLFKVPKPSIDDASTFSIYAHRYLKEATQKIKGREIKEFIFLVNDDPNNLKIDSCSMKDELIHSNVSFDVTHWNEFGFERMELIEGNKPIHVSYRMVSPVDRGLAVAMLPSSDEEGVSGLLISVTIPTII